MKEKIKKIALSSLFSIWFLCSIILLIKYKNDLELSLIITGQFMTIFGSIIIIGSICSKNKPLKIVTRTILFPIGGITMLTYGLLKKIDIVRFEKLWSFINSEFMNVEKILPLVLCAFSLIEGIILIVTQLISDYYSESSDDEKNFSYFMGACCILLGSPLIFIVRDIFQN